MAINIIALFCEDIREEKSGQVTLIGILPDNINVPPPPSGLAGAPAKRGIMPKLCLYVRVNVGLDDNPGPMTIKLELSDRSEIPIGTIDEELISTSKRQASEKGLPFAGMVQHVIFGGFQVPGPGLISVVLDTKDGQSICGALNLQQQEPPPA